jgi:hypothetical protein
MAESERAEIAETVLPFASGSIDARIVKGRRQWRQEHLAFFNTTFRLQMSEIQGKSVSLHALSITQYLVGLLCNKKQQKTYNFTIKN